MTTRKPTWVDRLFGRSPRLRNLVLAVVAGKYLRYVSTPWFNELHHAVQDPSTEPLVIAELARRVRLGLPEEDGWWVSQTIHVRVLRETLAELEQAARHDQERLDDAGPAYLLAADEMLAVARAELDRFTSARPTDSD